MMLDEFWQDKDQFFFLGFHYFLKSIVFSRRKFETDYLTEKLFAYEEADLSLIAAFFKLNLKVIVCKKT